MSYSLGIPGKDETLADYADSESNTFSYEGPISCATFRIFMSKNNYRFGLEALFQKWGDFIPSDDSTAPNTVNMRAFAGLASLSRAFGNEHIRVHCGIGVGRGNMTLSRMIYVQQAHDTYLDESYTYANIVAPFVTIGFPSFMKSCITFPFEVDLTAPAFFFDHKLTLTDYESPAEYTDYHLRGRMLLMIGIRITLDSLALNSPER